MVNAEPEVALDEGCVENTSELSAPGLIVKPFKQVVERVPSVALMATTFFFKIFTPLKLTNPDEFDGVPVTDAATSVEQDESE